MRSRMILSVGVAGVIALGMATGAQAQGQAARRGPFAGPTALFAVPEAYVLPAGTNIINGALYLGQSGVGVGLPANGLALSSHMGMGPGFEMDAGLMAAGQVPWRGAMSLSGKWNLLAAVGPTPTVSCLAGGVVAVDANGQPAIGAQIGLPVSMAIGINSVNSLGFTIHPALNVTMGAANAVWPGGPWPGSSSFLSLGLGGEFRALPNLVLLADTSLGIPGLTGINTQSNLGVRVGFGRAFLLDGFVGVGSSWNVAAVPTSVGIAGHWVY